MKNGFSIFLFSILFIFSCSDSKNPVGSEDPDNDTTTVSVQGVVKGPGSSTGKAPSVELNDQLPQKTEIISRPLNPDPPLSDKKNNAPEISGSFQMNAESSLTNESPFENVTVLVFELSDYISNQENAQLLNSATTNNQGQYSVSDLEKGINLVIVAESVPRQTLIVMNVDQESTGDINSATAIVSEYWAGEIADDKAFEEEKFEEMLQTADELLSELSAEGLRGLLKELVPGEFGQGFPVNLSTGAQHFVSTLMGIDIAVCEDIVFEISSGKPANYFLINGLSSEFGEEPLGWVYDSNNIDEENRFGVYIERINGNQAEMLIPIHPGNHIGGGSAIIEIYNENQSIVCPGISFEIEALANATGTFNQMVDNLESTFQNITQQFGYSHDELLTADIAELPVEAKALAASIQTISGSNNPNSIRQILSGDAPILEGEPLDTEVLELFDALMYESGLPEKVQTFNEIFDFQAKLMNSSSSGNCFVLPENISTPGELNCWMGVQAWFENENQGLSRELRDLTGAVLGVSAVVALATGVGAPVAAVFGMSATAVTMMHIFIDANDNTLPSQLLGFEIWGNPETYENEDDDTEGVWSADLAAQSNGWTLNWATTLGNVPGLGKVAGIFNKTGMPNAAEFLLQNFQREINNVWKADSGPIDLAPQIHQFTINNDRDEDYITWELNTKSQETSIDPFSFTQDEKGYTPEAVGTAELRVETKGGDVFKGQKVFNLLELEVQPISIIVRNWKDDHNPFAPPYYIGIDEELSLEARVENAINKEFTWTVAPEDDGLLSLVMPGREHIIELNASEPGIYTVEAESIADTGPRADNSPRRYDRVTIFVGGLNVSNPGCVEPNSTHQLTANIGGESISFNELEWDISGSGSIDSNGLYTAGGTGAVQIHFQVIDQPQLTDTISFSVKELCRSFSASSSEFNFTGECVFFSEYETRGVTTISFGYATFPRAWVSTLEVLSNVMSPDEAWSVTNPGWDWESVVLNSPIEYYGFSSFESGGARNYELEQEIVKIDGADVRVLSGKFEAIFKWYDKNNDIQQTSGVLQFSGALPASETDHAWTNCGNL